MFVMSSDRVPTIVVRGDVPEPVAFASRELVRYLERVLGREPMVSGSAEGPAIVLELTHDPGLGEEGYEVRVDGEAVTIRAQEPVGIVFGSYYFLTRFVGCRFSGLAPDGEYVPRRGRVEVEEGVTRRRPRLWYRGLQFAKTEGLEEYSAELAVKRVDWMAKNGMNFVLYNPKHDPGGGMYTDGWFFDKVVPEVRKRGLKLDMNHHNLLYWLPPERYFGEHPEWYAMRGGRRRARSPQLAICTSNPEAVGTLVRNVLDYLREHPEVRIVGVIPQDGWGMCECDECRKLDFPDEEFRTGRVNFRSPEGENRSKARRYALLVNEVARAVKEEFPGVYVGMAAYIDIQWPPRGVVLEENVVPWVAIYWRCSAHPLGPGSCAVNRLFWSVLEDWKEAHSGRLILYEYYMGMATYRSLPFPVAEVMVGEWPGLKELGVEGATIQSTGESHETYGLNYYTFARIGWEDEVEYGEVLDEYLVGMFGSVAPEVRPIWETLAGNLRRIGRLGVRANPYKEAEKEGCFTPNPWEFNAIASSKDLDMFEKCCRRAMRRATDEREGRQVEMLLASVRYWRMAGEAADLLFRARRADGEGRREEVVGLYEEFASRVGPMLEYEARFEGRGWMGLSNDAQQWRSSEEEARGRVRELGR